MARSVVLSSLLLLFAWQNSSATAPGNDRCSGAVVIPANGPFPFYTAVINDISEAGTAGDPPSPACANGVSNSVWYRFTPSNSSLFTFSVSDDTSTTVPDTVMALYSSSGGCNGPFLQLACNDDAGGLRSAISQSLSAGISYFVVVWVSPFSGPLTNGHAAVQLRVSQPVVPTNNICSGAELIPAGGPFPYLTAVSDNTLASSAGDPPVPSCQASVSRSVWYRFTPSATTTYTISTCSDTASTTYDTVLGIYTASSGCGGTYNLVACNDNSCGFRSAITTALNAGTPYFIVVWEAGSDPYVPGETSIQLRVSGFFPPLVMTFPASSIATTSAVLNAIVNPSGAATTAWFDWGTSTNYVTSTTGQLLGSGSSNIWITAMLANLTTNSPYFFRVRATNVLGSSAGTNLNFVWSPVRPSIVPSITSNATLFSLRFTGAAGQRYSVLTSTNLAVWTLMSDATETSPGHFSFSDTNSPGKPSRFYRILLP
jgi:hypothetical protein